MGKFEERNEIVWNKSNIEYTSFKLPITPVANSAIDMLFNASANQVSYVVLEVNELKQGEMR